MGGNIIGHVVHDGWESKYREDGTEHTQIIEPYLDSVRSFLQAHQNAQILSLIFWAKRFPIVESSGTHNDMGRFFERSYRPEQIAALPENWLEAIRQEITRVDNEQTDGKD